MDIQFHKNSKKQYQKLPKKIQSKFNERLELFLADESNAVLNIHPLAGKDKPLVSMNVTGDYRALFIQSRAKVTFYKIGTHAELYG